MASPAQIANDMAVHAAYWERRDDAIARACRAAARVIRAYLAGERVDGRTYGGLHGRLLNLERHEPNLQGYPDFCRARNCIEHLRCEATVR